MQIAFADLGELTPGDNIEPFRLFDFLPAAGFVGTVQTLPLLILSASQKTGRH